jgi:threonine efflux protein
MTMTLDTGVLWTFALLWLAIVPTPGANSLMITHVAMTQSRTHMWFALAGNIAGIVLLATCALLGWAAVLEAFPWLRLAVNVLGAAYLIYFGLRLVQRSRQTNAIAGAPEPKTIEGDAGARRALTLGFVTALSNAQAIIFITSIYAVAGVLHANVATGLASIAIVALCNASYLATLGAMLQRPAPRRLYQRFRRALEGAMGALFIVFGGRLLWREWAS